MVVAYTVFGKYVEARRKIRNDVVALFSFGLLGCLTRRRLLLLFSSLGFSLLLFIRSFPSFFRSFTDAWPPPPSPPSPSSSSSSLSPPPPPPSSPPSSPLLQLLPPPQRGYVLSLCPLRDTILLFPLLLQSTC